MTKLVLTKKQAISLLNCIERGVDPDMFTPVFENDKKYKLSCDELEASLIKTRRVDPDSLAGVVDNEVDVTPKRKP